ncbi:hypothetical protein MGU_02495 [Metarhizium guizhouense ARSEF 977]|uniref:Mg2+ transporter protein, CorA-like/Zinc transport protein ZntB n=1 Tax=Metarhizium guizhouense (strain ARSEF 977) TaxID=1276136 RepID=A0A0B4H5W4_METGA|nr:hypothetical protein MGU_02495 [Metarhizium guizhouense ARSEF 977]
MATLESSPSSSRRVNSGGTPVTTPQAMSRHAYMSRREDGVSAPCVPSPSPGYVLEGSAKDSHTQRHRRILPSVEELRAELLAGEGGRSQGRILVLRAGRVDGAVREALVSVARVDGGFIDAHAAGTAYRPRGGRRTPRWWWSCAYPEVAAGEGQVPLYRPGDGQALTISRMSVWLGGGGVPVVIVGHGAGPERRGRGHKLQREHGGAGYGAIGSARPGSTGRVEISSFEKDLWEALAPPDEVAIEEVLGELMLDRWTGCLAAMRPGTGGGGGGGGAGHMQEQESLWAAMAALESNLDEARRLSGRGRQLGAARASAWADLMRRLEMRVRLGQLGIGGEACRRQASPARGGKTDNDRSLDRIAYLGGLMLPVSAVASILAIGGDYGPGGESFWVFWLSSFLASVLAVLVIYADQLRTVEVWLETGELDDELLPWEGEDSEEHLVQRWADGSRRAAWERRELGWGGAVKKMSGYYWWRGDPRLAFRRPRGVKLGGL